SASLASITWSGGATLPGGLSAVLASALTTSVSTDSTTGSSGSIATTFSAPDKTFDFLAAGETLTITYNVTVTDNTGASLTQPVTITITGSNDAPMLAADAPGPHTVAEGVNTTATLAFTDVDLSDQHTVSTSVTSATWSQSGVTLPSGLAAVLAGALSTTVTDSTGSGSGSITATFSAADSAFDFLAVGQTLTVKYNVTVTDNNGAISTQPVTFTITGTNDAPVITGGDTTGSVIEGDSSHNQVRGQLTAFDPDFGATQTWTAVGATASTNANYHFSADSFSVTSTSGVNFLDQFSAGLPPPNSPSSTLGYVVTGTFGETAGKLLMDSNNAVPVIAVGTKDPFVGQFAVVKT